MGWFSSSSDSSAAAAKPTSDGGYIAPDRSARQLCWEGRDSFFQCLDRHNIIDAIKEDDKARKSCPKELKQFENACVESWVKYFKQRRVMEYQRDLTIKRLEGEGVQGLSDNGGLPLGGLAKKPWMFSSSIPLATMTRSLGVVSIFSGGVFDFIEDNLNHRLRSRCPVYYTLSVHKMPIGFSGGGLRSSPGWTTHGIITDSEASALVEELGPAL